MKILNLEEIKANINLESIIAAQKAAFTDFSSGLYDMPPPIQFSKGDCHIKAAYKKDSQHLVIKVATNTDGLMMILDAHTGNIKAILEDKSFLTTLRTAIAGLLVLDVVPWKVQNIGIVGNGKLAKQICELVQLKYPNVRILFHARSRMDCPLDDLLHQSDAIFTTTSSTSPIVRTLAANQVIIALGSDDEHKSEVDPNLFSQADMVVVDSKAQAMRFGDVARALKLDIISHNKLVELGQVTKTRASKIIADFSGIGAQDFAIAKCVFSKD